MVHLEKGTRIYYTGDMSNNEDFGTVVNVERHPRWGVSVDIKLDDGRDIRRLSLIAFSPEYLGHGGTRFVTVAAYNAYRRAQFPKCEVYQYPEKEPTMKRFLILMSGCGVLTVRNPDSPDIAELKSQGWIVALKVNRAFTEARKNAAYLWAIRCCGA